MNNSNQKLKTIDSTQDGTEECCEPITGTEQVCFSSVPIRFLNLIISLQKNNIELSILPLVSNPPKKEPKKRIRYFSEASEK